MRRRCPALRPASGPLANLAAQVTHVGAVDLPIVTIVLTTGARMIVADATPHRAVAAEAVAQDTRAHPQIDAWVEQVVFRDAQPRTPEAPIDLHQTDVNVRG